MCREHEADGQTVEQCLGLCRCVLIEEAADGGIDRALEAAGVEFIDENGGGPGVRLRNRTLGK